MAKPFNKVKHTGILGLDDQLGFGKHIGYTVLEVLKDKPDYILWLTQNTDLKFYPSVLEELIRQKNPDQLSYNRAYHLGRFYRDESHNIFSDQDDWFDDVPF